MEINASSEKKAYAAFRYDQPTGTQGKRLKDKQLAELLNTANDLANVLGNIGRTAL